jgi:hypothetical protein
MEKADSPTSRFQELEKLGFVWNGDDATCRRERAVKAPEQMQTLAQIQDDFSVREICSNQVDVAAEPDPG